MRKNKNTNPSIRTGNQSFKKTISKRNPEPKKANRQKKRKPPDKGLSNQSLLLALDELSNRFRATSCALLSAKRL